MVTKARCLQGINPRSIFHQGLIRVLYTHAVQHRVEPIPRPRGRNREVGGLSNEIGEGQAVNPAGRTRAQRKQRESGRSNAPVTAKELQEEEVAPRIGNATSDKSIEAHGQSQTYEEMGNSRDDEVSFQKNVK